MIWWGTSTVVNLIGLLPDATGLLERWVVVRGGFCCSLNAEWESLPSSRFTFAPPPPPQLGSSYIISRLWCYIKDAWLSCCLTQRGPPVWVELLLERGPNAQTRTQTHTCYRVNAVELSQSRNLLFDRWMWEAVTETKCFWERHREPSGWTEIAS